MPAENVDEILRHLRTNCSRYAWPTAYDMAQSVNAVMAQHRPSFPPTVNTPATPRNATDDEKKHAAECLEKVREIAENAGTITDRLKHYRNWLKAGNTGPMANAASDFWLEKTADAR